ncbi:MAG: hypothetical protein HY880_07980 [Deltaproteobacteria bacterium]|nr:hypothetical protein [Deltaproteobacteria bacterium]
MEELVDIIKGIQDGLRDGRFADEASVSQGIILPLLQRLGWPVFDTRIVRPQYAVEARRGVVDFALFHPTRKKAVIFVEVKRVGHGEGADRQLFEYAFHEGVPMAMLSDGREWHFYLPTEQGNYEERRVYKLDLLERDASEGAVRLERYLSYQRVCSGESLKDAKKDHEDISRKREARQALPQAWERLVNEKNDTFFELIADKVESICGYKPGQDAVVEFLNGLFSRDIHRETAPFLPARMEKGSFGFVLNDREVRCRNGKDVLIKVIEELSANDKDFLERFGSLKKHGSKRRWISRRREDLYPGRPDLCRGQSYQLKSGWWAGTNYSKGNIETILRMACDAVGLRWGKDLVVSLGD